MALIKCIECGKEISSEAPTCPGCGAPVKPPKIKKGGNGIGCGGIFLLIIFFIFFLWAVGTTVSNHYAENKPAKTSVRSPVSTPAPTRDEIGEQIEKYRHLQPERKKAIQDLVNDGTIMKITKTAKYPHVFVGSKFYLLPFDIKKSIMQVIQLTYMTEDREADIVAIYDGYSGKEIGQYDIYGLRLD